MREVQEIFDIYAEVFSGRTDYIPLIVSTKTSGGPSRREFVEDTANAIEKAIESFMPRCEIGSDWIPSVNIGWYQCISVPSFYGAHVEYLEGSEPIVKPVFDSVETAVKKTEAVKFKSRIIDEMLNVLKIAISCAPEDVYISFPPTASPFDLASLMLGTEEYLISFMLYPDLIRRFLFNLARDCVDVIKLVRKEFGDSLDKYVTNRGIYFPGFRLPCDSIVNLSPGIIDEYILPILEYIAREIGDLCIHYCTKPSPAYHVLPELCKCRYVKAVDTWQGPDAFVGEKVKCRLQDSVGLIFDVKLQNEVDMELLLKSDYITVVKRKGGRPIVLSTWVPDVDTGKFIYNLWKEKFLL